MGCPIRISADQSLFAAPHGFSQRTTSFIACACQGIHRTPLRHLIALIFNARPNSRSPKRPRGFGRQCFRSIAEQTMNPRTRIERQRRRNGPRKTSVTRELSDGAALKHRQLSLASRRRRPDNSSLHDVNRRRFRRRKSENRSQHQNRFRSLLNSGF